MCANEFKTKEKPELSEIKKINCNISMTIDCQKSHQIGWQLFITCTI